MIGLFSLISISVNLDKFSLGRIKIQSNWSYLFSSNSGPCDDRRHQRVTCFTVLKIPQQASVVRESGFAYCD